MKALVEAVHNGTLSADVAVVVAPKDGTDAQMIADSLGVPTAVVMPGDRYGDRLMEVLTGCEWLCLAGFLRILPSEVLEHFPNRVLNIHPSLLPKFGGKGMYGHHVHEAVIAAGEVESGCTVHIVNEYYDDGAIILQKKCPVFPDDTPDLLAQRVLALEHQAFSEALQKVIDERSR